VCVSSTSNNYGNSGNNKDSNYYKKQHVIKIKRVIAPQQSIYNTQQALDTHVHIHTHNRGTIDTATRVRSGTIDTATRVHCAATAAVTALTQTAAAAAAAVVVQSSVSAVMLLSNKLAVVVSVLCATANLVCEMGCGCHATELCSVSVVHY
jgi:hypothetical protein